jgi:hypothetical protein
LQAAVRILELDCKARRMRGQGYPLTLEECINGEQLPGDVRSQLRDLVDARSAKIYGHYGSESLTEEERSRIIALLNRWNPYV